MAILDSTSFDSAYVSKPASKIDVTLEKGRIRRAYASYTLSGEVTTADTIRFFKLPKGARIIDARFVAPSDGTTGQYNIGWDGGEDSLETADDNGLFDNLVADSGGGAVDAKLLGTDAGYNYKLADSVVIQADVAENTTASSGDTLELEVHYVLD